jgi:2-C-methyl-D-erythritol 4-phosphate cytidylyltransferase
LTHFAGVIAAAGAGRRMAAETKKVYLPLKDRPLLVWAVEPFLSCPGLLRLVVVVPQADTRKTEDLLAAHLPLERVGIVAGGTRRQDSVYRGLLALEDLDPRIVLVHDGARPFIRRELIERVAATARRCGACIPVRPALEATKLVGDSGLVISDLPRHHVMLAQTPQGFHYSALLAAFLRAEEADPEREYVDEAEIFGAHAGPVCTIPGDGQNRKITYPQDLEGRP